ncbi:MAG: hypothetical protein NT149_00600 [Candidatus Gottesmanbacteria bacterium]|nr:hypothetical protein [Candidatus Gottesmanbacteria bacterium]
MPAVESKAAYTELSGRIDQQFPYSKLLKWAAQLKKAGYQPPIDPENLMQLVRHVTMHRTFVETLEHEALLGDRDIFITRPSTGKLVEIHHGSFFFPNKFRVLEDQQLDVFLPEFKLPIPRAAFAAAMDGANITVGSIIVPHHLPLEDVDIVVKWHALKTALHLQFKNDQEAVMCFYGGMKIVANRLLYGVDSAA